MLPYASVENAWQSLCVRFLTFAEPVFPIVNYDILSTWSTATT
jgi:hypothetical protein